jgi:hypothetical protein
MDYSGLTDADLWSLAVGFFAPPVISIIQQSKWSARTQSLVALAFYVAVAAVGAYLAGNFDAGNLVRSALLVFLMGSAAYKAVWKPTGVSPAIEAATSPKPADGRHEAE